jgi:hypothetical protein
MPRATTNSGDCLGRTRPFCGVVVSRGTQAAADESVNRSIEVRDPQPVSAEVNIPLEPLCQDTDVVRCRAAVNASCHEVVG